MRIFKESFQKVKELEDPIFRKLEYRLHYKNETHVTIKENTVIKTSKNV